ncbi:MAG TPA: hypothetical protein VFQ05_12440 [Candidatus Eisenbacteria bacterium]|nr:hypothetical protein [Candidatus Eisenbacteria bacterium]
MSEGRVHRFRPAWPDILLALGCAVASLWVYRSALGAYFSPDDLILLERARGLAPQLTTVWRYLSGRAYFDLVSPWFGIEPSPYMVVNVLLHAACVALLYAFARRHGGRLAATVAAGLFGTSRLFYSVVSQVVGVGEMLALALALASALALSAQGVWARRSALPLFVAALLSKESVALVPLALLLSPAVGKAWRERARRIAPLVAASVAMIGYVLLSGVRETALGGRPYETAFGANLLRAGAHYASWSTDLVTLIPDYYGATTTVPWIWAALVLVVGAGLAWLARGRTRAPIVGWAWWLLALLPVLPLQWQRYLNYLYAPAAGLALALGGITEWLLARERITRPTAARPAKRSRRPERRPWPWRNTIAWALAVLIVGAHAARSDQLLQVRLGRRLPYMDIPLDPFVRKVELARRVATRIEESLGGRHASIVFYIPNVGDNPFFANLLKSVLDDGRGLRAVCPTVDSVAFVSRWTPEYRDFELIAGSVDGFVDNLGRGAESHLRLADKLVRFNFPREADEHLRAAAIAYPDDARLALARATVVAQLGRSDEAAAECRRAIELSSAGSLADSARAMLRRLDATAARD